MIFACDRIYIGSTIAHANFDSIFHQSLLELSNIGCITRHKNIAWVLVVISSLVNPPIETPPKVMLRRNLYPGIKIAFFTLSRTMILMIRHRCDGIALRLEGCHHGSISIQHKNAAFIHIAIRPLNELIASIWHSHNLYATLTLFTSHCSTPFIVVYRQSDLVDWFRQLDIFEVKTPRRTLVILYISFTILWLYARYIYRNIFLNTIKCIFTQHSRSCTQALDISKILTTAESRLVDIRHRSRKDKIA